MKKNNRALGSTGEHMAQAYLMNQGYTILERNYRCRLGEVDLIANNEGYLAFIEVKLRKSTTYGLPREAVDARKQRQIMKVASWYLSANQITDRYIRFDVVEIFQGEKTTLNLIKNAFWA